MSLEILGISERDLRANKPVYVLTTNAGTPSQKDVYVKVASKAVCDDWLEQAAVVEELEGMLRGAMAADKFGAAMGLGKGSEVASKRGSEVAGKRDEPVIDFSQLNEDVGGDEKRGSEEARKRGSDAGGGESAEDRVNVEDPITGGTPVPPLADRAALDVGACRAAFQEALFEAVASYPGLEQEDLGSCSWAQIVSAFVLLKALSDPFDFSTAWTQAIQDRQFARIPSKVLEKAMDGFGKPGSS